MKTLKLDRYERIIAVVPERAHGPGWANQPVWVYISDPTGKLRMECLQPDEQSAAMLALFQPGAAMAKALAEAVPIERDSSEVL